MYSEQLKKAATDTANALQTERISNLLDGFCKRDDLIGVRCDHAFELFKKYAKEQGVCEDFETHKFGIAIKQKFGLKKRKTRFADRIVNVYVE